MDEQHNEEAVCSCVCVSGEPGFPGCVSEKASLEALLETHGLARYFTDYIAKEDPYPRKPDPESLNALIMQHDLDRDQCLLIGDRELDIVAGQCAGIRTCFFGTELHEAQPDLEITEYAVLHRWLLAENAAL